MPHFNFLKFFQGRRLNKILYKKTIHLAERGLERLEITTPELGIHYRKSYVYEEQHFYLLIP